MYHKMRVCLAGTPAQAKARDPVITGRIIRLRRKLMMILFGPEEKLAILIPGKTVKDITIKEETEDG